ncbi:NACHT, LRR and PYD domains-containing protein 3-like [Heterodontus francisci]|uniref:NACHT, LRR and PYD domains-containing protein 3-like n=1 Tax=Heterodontus francisci TaxID=7792 RepID=UPI00355AD1FE
MGNSGSKKFELHGVQVTTNKSPPVIRCSRPVGLEIGSENRPSPQASNIPIQGSSDEKDRTQRRGLISESTLSVEQYGRREEKYEVSYPARDIPCGTDGSTTNAPEENMQTLPASPHRPTGGDAFASCQVKTSENLEGTDILKNLPEINPLIKETLASYNDRDLYKITKFYRQRLEEGIEEFVEIVSGALLRENMFTNTEHQSIKELIEKGNRREASRQLFDFVIEHGAQAGRTMWVVFVKLRDTKPKLKNILTEIYEKGVNLPRETILSTVEQKVSDILKDIQEEHRESLRSQTEKLLVSNIQVKQIQTFSLSERYTELIVIANVRERRLLEHELWARGRDHEEWQKKLVRDELEKIRIHQLFRDCFGKSSIAGTAVVSGVAGIGKTTMVQKIVHDWAAGRMYPQFNFVFHFKFRDLNAVSGSTSLKALVLHSYPYFERVIQYLWEDPESLLFIFDGLDEFKVTINFDNRKGNMEAERDCFDPGCRCELADIVCRLVQQKLLKGCSVLITSRPHALDSLERADVNLWAEILGFFAEERREYFNKFYGSVEVAAAVFRQVEQNDILYTMCYNPSYCWILCSSLAPTFSNPEVKQQLPRTITQLFSNYIYNILNNHARQVENPRDILLKAGEMALDGVSSRTIVFSQNHFQQHSLEPSKFVSGFMMEILEKDHSATSVVYTFIHLTIQEYLAALSPYLKKSPENLTELLKKAESMEDGRFDVFIRFMVGLSAPSTSQQLVKFLGNFQCEAPCQVKFWLTQKVKAQLSSTQSKKDRKKLLNTFHYVFESQDNLMRFTGDLGLKVTLGHNSESQAIRLNPVDCFVLATVLGNCDIVEELDLNYCYIQAEGIQRLAPILHKCKILRLLSNNLTDSGMTELAASLRKSDCKIQILELNINGLTDNCAEVLASALSTNQSLYELDLQRNRFRSGAPFCQLIKACTSLQKISLSWNQFSGEAKKGLRLLHESRPGLAVLV